MIDGRFDGLLLGLFDGGELGALLIDGDALGVEVGSGIHFEQVTGQNDSI